jgi:glutamate dehydrogenase/leucine dehydrogenase
MSSRTKDEEILEEYQKQTNTILQNMLQILTRAQRKADSAAYKAALEKLREKDDAR